MQRDDLIRQTRALVEEGERIERAPSRAALNTWLAASDALLSDAWGQMDRYHQAWLDVGRIAQPLRGRQISADEEAAEVRAVAAAKGAVLRASLDAVERLNMPFLGETRGRAREERAGLPDHLHEAPHGLVGGASALEAAIERARTAAEAHEDHALNRRRTPQKSDRTDLW
ncbi:MAG: hypothetical protein RLZZ432_919 [Chloroflexota bacterium]